MDRAQLFYLLLLPEGPEPELPAGSSFEVSQGGGRTHWELVLDEDGPQPFVRDIEREMFIERLVATCPRRYLVHAIGPREKVFADAAELFKVFLEDSPGGWVNDLISARLLSRKRALEIAATPVSEQQLHIASYEPGPGVITRGLLKLGHSEIAIRYEQGLLRDRAKMALLLAAQELIDSGEPLTPGRPREIDGFQVVPMIPPGVYTAKIASAPAGAHDHHQHWVQRALEGRPFEPGGVLVLSVPSEGDEDATPSFLESRTGELPRDFLEPGVAGHEHAAQALASILGEPDRALRVATEEDPDEFIHVLHYEEKVAQGGGTEVRDLYVTAGLSERPQPGPLVDHRVELGFITPKGGVDWVPQLVMGLRTPAPGSDAANVQFTAGVTIGVDAESPVLKSFGGLLFIPPVFLPAEEATLTIAPPNEESREVLVLLVVPLTKAELEFKADKGFEALVEKLQETHPGGRWLVSHERDSAV